MDKPTRRDVLKTVGVVCASFTFPISNLLASDKSRKVIKLGVIADLHGGFIDDAESRLDSFLLEMKNVDCDALVQLGDFAYPNKDHQHYPDKFNAAHDTTIHVIGNHEFDYSLTREDCYKAWSISSSYYTKDIGDLRVIILDGNERGSPDYEGGYPSYIGEAQVSWLKSELERADKPVLILCHQPIAGAWPVDNYTEIQNLLSVHANNIVACVNGHSHLDCLHQIGGVNYLHLNSASYYWVGGEERMAFYTDPLFTTLTIDLENGTVMVEGLSSTWKGVSPEEMGYFEEEGRPEKNCVTPQIRPRTLDSQENLLKVMTWNIWGRLNQAPQYTLGEKTGRERTIEIIQKSGADVIAMIETYGSAADIAKALGFYHHTPADDANLCIFSRYPLSDIELLEGISSFSFIGATVTLPDGQQIRIYDIWLTSSGRHIVDIKNKEISDQEFANGDDVRFDHLLEFLNHDNLKRHLANSDKIPVIMAGDFNCVSHLDHTEESAEAGLNQSRVLSIKVSQAMAAAGFVDSYRSANPELSPETLGHTWTTVGMDFVYKEDQGFVATENNPEPQYRDPYSRIDYIYSQGPRLEIVSSSVISKFSSRIDRSFPEFPSDHAAVITNYRVKRDL